MGRTTVQVAVLLCLFFSLTYHGGRASQEADEAAVGRTLKPEILPKHEVHCSRERSRAASSIIDEYLMPFVEQEEYQLSPKCRLHPENDMFREQEQHKIHVDTNEWKCGFCKKSFRSEKFLDQHFDNRHYNLLDNSQGRCVADLCGALHCDHVMESKKKRSKCNPAAAARNRHLCESLADSCFPISQGLSASHLHEFFLRQFCDAHACSGGKKPFTRGGRKKSSISYMAISILIVMMLPVFYLLVYLHQRTVEFQFLEQYRFSLFRASPIFIFGHKKSSIFYMAISILIVMMLPVFYLLVYLHQRDVKKGIQDLKRISKAGRKIKPS